MFDDIVQPSIRVGSRGTFALPLSIATHLLAVAIVLITPLMVPGLLPTPSAAVIAFVRADVALPSPPPPAPRQPVVETAPQGHVDPAAVPCRKRRATSHLRSLSNQSHRWSERLKAVATCTVEIAEHLAPPLPPPSAPEPPLRVGGSIRPPNKIKEVNPVYPTLARAAHVEGLVIVEATIGLNRKGPGREAASFDSAARCSSSGSCSTVGIHTHVAEWQPGVAGHDGHRELHPQMNEARVDQTMAVAISAVTGSVRVLSREWFQGHGRAVLSHAGAGARRRRVRRG